MRITDFLTDIGIIDAGWIRHEGPAGVALFPETADDDQEWELRCAELHRRLAADTTHSPTVASGNGSATDGMRIVRV